MPKKTNPPHAALKNETEDGPLLPLPSLKIKAEGTDSPLTEKEEADYAAIFDEAEAISKQKDMRKAIEDEIGQLESYTSKTPRESLDKAKSLKALQLRLRSLAEPKRLNQRHRLKVREIAKKLWQNHPDWTIQILIECDEVNEATAPRVYHERTLRYWIKELAPNRQPGRRKAPR